MDLISKADLTGDLGRVDLINKGDLGTKVVLVTTLDLSGWELSWELFWELSGEVFWEEFWELRNSNWRPGLHKLVGFVGPVWGRVFATPLN